MLETAARICKEIHYVHGFLAQLVSKVPIYYNIKMLLRLIIARKLNILTYMFTWEINSNKIRIKCSNSNNERIEILRKVKWGKT